MKNLYLLLLVGLFQVGGLQAADSNSDFHWDGLLDGRLVQTDKTPGWLDGGLGKTLYGGELSQNTQEQQTSLNLAEASVILRTEIDWSWSAYVHLKSDPEQKQSIDLVEGFVSFKPVSTSSLQLEVRAGAFFPPVSYENEGLAWTNTYTLSNSAINTWIGEEIRTLGLETRLTLHREDSVWRFWASAFGANDPAGSLLVWRGWALHDRETGITDRLPLPALPAIEEGGIFAGQVRWVEPFHELDGRLGGYAALEFENPEYGRVRILQYDNFADVKEFDGRQYAWRTRFQGAGLEAWLPWELTLVSQYLTGDTLMFDEQYGVYADYSSGFLLISKSIDSQIVTVRYEQFNIIDNDHNFANDDNSETGSAYTLAYRIGIGDQQLLLVELIKVNSDRPARTQLGWEREVTETLVQIAYRLKL